MFVCDCSCKCGACTLQDCDCECHDLTASTKNLRQYVHYKKLSDTERWNSLSRNQIFGIFAGTDDPEKTLMQAERFCKAIETSKKQISRSSITKRKPKQTECDDDE